MHPYMQENAGLLDGHLKQKSDSRTIPIRDGLRKCQSHLDAALNSPASPRLEESSSATICGNSVLLKTDATIREPPSSCRDAGATQNPYRDLFAGESCKKNYSEVESEPYQIPQELSKYLVGVNTTKNTVFSPPCAL